MRESESQRSHEVPGGARRAETFLLGIASLIAVVVVPGFRAEHEPVISLLAAAIWLQVLARWLRHLRPQYASAVAYLGAFVLGAALYAGMAGR